MCRRPCHFAWKGKVGAIAPVRRYTSMHPVGRGWINPTNPSSVLLYSSPLCKGFIASVRVCLCVGLPSSPWWQFGQQQQDRRSVSDPLTPPAGQKAGPFALEHSHPPPSFSSPRPYRPPAGRSLLTAAVIAVLGHPSTLLCSQVNNCRFPRGITHTRSPTSAP